MALVRVRVPIPNFFCICTGAGNSSDGACMVHRQSRMYIYASALFAYGARMVRGGGGGGGGVAS